MQSNQIMRIEHQRQILFDYVDGIPFSENENTEVLNYASSVDENPQKLEEEARNCGLKGLTVEYIEDS